MVFLWFSYVYGIDLPSQVAVAAVVASMHQGAELQRVPLHRWAPLV